MTLNANTVNDVVAAISALLGLKPNLDPMDQMLVGLRGFLSATQMPAGLVEAIVSVISYQENVQELIKEKEHVKGAEEVIYRALFEKCYIEHEDRFKKTVAVEIGASHLATVKGDFIESSI